MTTISYPIKRWGGILTNNNINPHPVVYIKPDDELIKFALLTDNKLLVSISNTDLPYDNIELIGLFKLDCNRPNKTGYYMIVLMSDWHGEPEDPSKLGNINIHGFKKPDLLVQNSTDKLNSINGFSNFTASQTSSTFIGVLIFILVVCLVFFYTRSLNNTTTSLNDTTMENNPYRVIKPVLY